MRRFKPDPSSTLTLTPFVKCINVPGAKSVPSSVGSFPQELIETISPSLEVKGRVSGPVILSMLYFLGELLSC